MATKAEQAERELDRLIERLNRLNQEETISYTYEVYAPAWPKKNRRFILGIIPQNQGWRVIEWGTTLREFQPFVQYLNGMVDALDLARVNAMDLS